MSKKIIFIILAIILIGVIGFALIHREQEENILETESSKLNDIGKNLESKATIKNEPVLIKYGKGNYCEKGYYHIESEENQNNIKYFDYSAKKEIYLCNKPNCNHNTEECSSYLNKLNSHILFVYNNYIYLIENVGEIKSVSMSNNMENQLMESITTPFIYKMNLDGTNRTKIFECPSGVEIGTDFICDGENLYTFFTKSKSVNIEKNSYTTVETEKNLVKINLKTQKYETICESKNKTILRII